MKLLDYWWGIGYRMSTLWSCLTVDRVLNYTVVPTTRKVLQVSCMPRYKHTRGELRQLATVVKAWKVLC